MEKWLVHLPYSKKIIQVWFPVLQFFFPPKYFSPCVITQLLSFHPAESPGPGPDAAPVSAHLWGQQYDRVLQTNISLLPPLHPAVPLRRKLRERSPDRRRRRWDPHSGQTRRGRPPPAQSTPPAPAGIQEPGRRDPHHGEEDGGESRGAVHGLGGPVREHHHNAASFVKYTVYTCTSGC